MYIIICFDLILAYGYLHVNTITDQKKNSHYCKLMHVLDPFS